MAEYDVGYRIDIEGNYDRVIKKFNADLDASYLKAKAAKAQLNDMFKSQAREHKLASDLQVMRTKARVAAEIREERRLAAEKVKLLRDQERQRKKMEAEKGKSFFSGGISGIMRNPVVAQGLAMYEGARMIGSVGIALANATIKQEGFKRSVGATSNGVHNFGVNMALVDNMAAKYGSDINSLRESFMQFNGATNGTNLAGERTRRVFESITKASSVMSLSSEDTKLALLAVSQMASKGVVSMEELRRQLMERIPISFQTLANKMGMTSAQFMKAVESGSVMSEDFIPKLAEALDDLSKGKGVDKLAVKMGRIGNQITAIKESSGNLLRPVLSGSMDVLSTFLDASSWRKALDARMMGIPSAINMTINVIQDGKKKRYSEADINDGRTLEQKYANEIVAKTTSRVDAQKKALHPSKALQVKYYKEAIAEEEKALSSIPRFRKDLEGDWEKRVSDSIQVEYNAAPGDISVKAIHALALEQLQQGLTAYLSGEQGKIDEIRAKKKKDDEDFEGTKVEARAPKHFSIVINKFVAVENYQAGAGDVKSVVAENSRSGLMEALAELQIQAENL